MADAPIDYLKMLLDAALMGKKPSARDLLRMFSERKHWIKVHSAEHGEMQCWWAWNGPVLPPFEILERHFEEEEEATELLHQVSENLGQALRGAGVRTDMTEAILGDLRAPEPPRNLNHTGSPQGASIILETSILEDIPRRPQTSCSPRHRWWWEAPPWRAGGTTPRRTTT